MLIKHKNERFAERAAGSRRPPAKRSDEYARLLQAHLGAVTRARFDNVQSKRAAPFGRGDVREALQALADDVFEEVAREDPADLGVLDDKERAALVKVVRSTCGKKCAQWVGGGQT